QAGLRRRRMPVRGSDEVVERPYRPRVDELVCFEHGDPGGVVATVLEALQALQQQRLGGPTADVSDDSAHAVATSFRAPARDPARAEKTLKPGLRPSRRRDGQPSS